MDLEHLADVPSLDPRTWTVNRGGPGSRDILPPEGGSYVPFDVRTPNPEPRVPSPEPPPSLGTTSPSFGVTSPPSLDLDRASARQARNLSPVCVAIDVMDEAHSLRLAMRRLASDAGLRRTLGAAGRAYWQREHSVEGMVADYRVALAEAAATPRPHPALPHHLVNDGEDRLHLLLADVGVGSLWDKL